MFVPINFLHPIPKWNITGSLQQNGLFQKETIFDVCLQKYLYIV